MDTLVSNPWVKNKITRELRKYFKLNDNEHKTHQNHEMQLTVLRGKFLAFNACIRKEEKL